MSNTISCSMTYIQINGLPELAESWFIGDHPISNLPGRYVQPVAGMVDEVIYVMPRCDA